MPRLQAAAAGALVSFCDVARMQAEWLYAPAPPGLVEVGGTIGAALLDSLCELVRGSPSVVVKEEALTAVGCVAQVRQEGRCFGCGDTPTGDFATVQYSTCNRQVRVVNRRLRTYRNHA